MPAPVDVLMGDVLMGEDRPISRDAQEFCNHQKSSTHNFLSDNTKEDCKLSPIIYNMIGVSPLSKEDITRITLAYLPVETLLVVKSINSHLRNFVNEEALHRLTSDCSEFHPNLNCLVKAMHGAFACRKGCRSLKTLMLMKRCKEEAESKGSASSSEDEESFDMLCLCAYYGSGSCTRCRGYGYT